MVYRRGARSDRERAGRSINRQSSSVYRRLIAKPNFYIRKDRTTDTEPAARSWSDRARALQRDFRSWRPTHARRKPVGHVMSRTRARIAVSSLARRPVRVLRAAACIWSPALSLWLFTYALCTVRTASNLRVPTSAMHLIFISLPSSMKCRGSASNRSPRLFGMPPLLMGVNGGCWTVFSRGTCNEYDRRDLMASCWRYL